MSAGWGPDLRGAPEPTRPDVQQRYDDDARTLGYFGNSQPVPVVDSEAPRPDVQNPRREDKRRGRAYTSDPDDDL